MKKLVKTIVLIAVAGLVICGCCCRQTTTIKLTKQLCQTQGRRLPDGVIPTPTDIATDAYCAKQLINTYAKDGTITIFGSSRIQPNTKSYKNIKKFAFLWTKAAGKKYPILTGGGPGIMKAAHSGARLAGGNSLAFGMFFKEDVATFAQLTRHVTASYMFASFAQRESAMVNYAKAIVIAPGGPGTEWEMFEAISKIQTHKKNPCPVILLGSKKVWRTLFARLNAMRKMKTISPKAIKILQLVTTPEKAVKIIRQDLLGPH